MTVKEQLIAEIEDIDNPIALVQSGSQVGYAVRTEKADEFTVEMVRTAYPT